MQDQLIFQNSILYIKKNTTKFVIEYNLFLKFLTDHNPLIKYKTGTVMCIICFYQY